MIKQLKIIAKKNMMFSKTLEIKIESTQKRMIFNVKMIQIKSQRKIIVQKMMKKHHDVFKWKSSRLYKNLREKNPSTRVRDN